MGNTYLEGNYAPVQCEHTITELAVTGTIPAHLDGRYLRNGPNPVGALDPETYHWFTGDGMVHGVRLREGTAQWYRNRWILRSPAGRRRLRAACATSADPVGAFRAHWPGPAARPPHRHSRAGNAWERQPALRWNPKYPARVGVMPRGGAGDVRWFDIKPCYVFHSLNAYDDGDTIVLDVARHPRMFVTDLHGPNEGPTTLDRWIVYLADGKIRETCYGYS